MYARLHAYLDSLPQGLDSFPECRVKASLLRGALDDPGARVKLDALPERLASLFGSPPLVTQWMPEVVSVAAHYAIADARGFDDDDVLMWTYRVNQRLAQSRLYRAMTAVATPRLALRGARLAWGMIHKGIGLSVRLEDDSARLTVTHPRGVWPNLVHRANATGFRAVLESSGGSNVEVFVAESSPDRAIFDCSWT